MASTIDFDGGLTLATECGDLDRSLAWYTEMLGFTVLYRMDEMGWAELVSPVAKVLMGLSQVEHPKVGAGPVPTWGVKDIDVARAELEAKAVKFDGETQTIPDMVKLATFFDPDGHAHMLYQSLTES